MTKQKVQEVAAPGGESVFDKAVLLCFKVSVIGMSRKGDLGAVETDADKGMLTLSKNIIECDEYKALKSYAEALRKEVAGKCLGAATATYTSGDGTRRKAGTGLQGLIKSGCYLCPLGLVSAVEDLIADRLKGFTEAVEAFIKVYPDKVEEARDRLKSQADSGDYPSVKRIRAGCGVTWKYLQVGVPGSLADVRRDVFERERAKVEAEWREASREMVAVQRVLMKELVDHLVEVLTPAGGGKKKRFYDTTISKLQEFIADFSAKNIANDEELQALVNKAKGVLAGTDADSFRTSDKVRGEVLRRMADVKKELDGCVEEVSERMVILDG